MNLAQHINSLLFRQGLHPTHYVILTGHPKPLRSEGNLEGRQFSILPVARHSLSESTDYADCKAKRRLPYSLGRVDRLFLSSCAAQQGDPELLWHVSECGNLVLTQVLVKDLPIRSVVHLLHGDVAKTLHEGALNLSNVNCRV